MKYVVGFFFNGRMIFEDFNKFESALEWISTSPQSFYSVVVRDKSTDDTLARFNPFEFIEFKSECDVRSAISSRFSKD